MEEIKFFSINFFKLKLKSCMEIDDFLKLTEKEVKKYIKSCGINNVTELYKAKDVISKLNLTNCSTGNTRGDIVYIEDKSVKAIIRSYHREPSDGVKISIYYDYSRDDNFENTPVLHINLRMFNNSKDRIGTVRWEDVHNEQIYVCDDKYFSNNGEQLHLWRDSRLSDFNTPWDYIQAVKKERLQLEPLLTNAIDAMNNGELDLLFKSYTGELLNPNRNQFCASAGYTSMIYKGAINNLSLDDAFVCYIIDLVYEKQYCPDEFSYIKKPILSYLSCRFDDRIDTEKFLDSLYSDLSTINYLKILLINSVDKNTLKDVAKRKLVKQVENLKTEIEKEFGLENYFEVKVESA